MKKTEIFAKMQSDSKINNLKAPSKIDFEIDDKGQLIISINSELVAKDNMQEDNLAFESWMLCIKASNYFCISRVILIWKPLSRTTPHYNRFKFRVMKCLEYFKWFSVDKTCESEIANFSNEFKNEKFVINYPKNKASEKAENKESFLERGFLKNKRLYKNVDFKYWNHQLPVGVFKNLKSRDALFFTGGKSAIDLWGIRDDEFWIFELKFESKMIGIITELLFYMWLCEELFIEHRIQYDDDDMELKKSVSKDFRGFQQIHTYSKNGINKINGVMLYDNDSIHPLITESGAVKYVNECFDDKVLTIFEQSYRTQSLSIELL